MFDKKRYTILIILIGLLILGYLLMSGSAKIGPLGFDEKIFSFRRITLSPIVIVSVYIAFIWLIMKKPDKQ